MNIGYIYIRINEYWDTYNACKLGKTQNIPEREGGYVTCEIKRGTFIMVIEVEASILDDVEKRLQEHFKELHVFYGCGNEFFKKDIIDLIRPWFDDNDIRYRLLSVNEVDKLLRKDRESNENVNESSNATDYMNNLIKSNEQQQYILENIGSFFHSNNIGKIVWACGLGKALLSILIVKLLKFKTTLIGVPSIHLQQQIKKEILKIFPNKNNILFIGGFDIKSTTNKKQIIKFLDNNIDNECKFVISTYHSCHLLADKNIKFEFKIGDEAHHLVGIDREEHKGFRIFHKISSVKSLFMTATEKTIETRTSKEIYSMDDETIFGKYIDAKSVNWSIEHKKITDYNILILKNTDVEVDDILSSIKLNVLNKEIFISCYMCLKSFEKYNDLTHLLLYTNTTQESELAKKYIDDLLALNILSIPKERIYNNSVHSKSCHNISDEVCEFKRRRYGIISCVYIFGEGFDLPKLNGVCIAGNMQSETRIVQYLLRPNRLEFGNPSKKAYVIIPYIDSDDWNVENKSYEKVRTIVSQMRNVDENIEQKISVSLGKTHKINKYKMDDDTVDDYTDYVYEDNGGDLNKIKIRLRYSKSLGSKFTEEQDEYNYVRSINHSLKIQSKKEYVIKKDIHINFIPNPDEYFKSKGVWNNWYDFMGLDTTKFIKYKVEWINFCREKQLKSLDDYYVLCEEYDVLPKEPGDFYKDFTNISAELGLNRNRRR